MFTRCLVVPLPIDLSCMATDSSQKKGGRKRNENNRIYANPLPITFSRIENRFTVTALGIFGVSPAQVLNPRCEGTFDPTTRSVWITNTKDSMTLWRRGFFGKGNLSRSEPSWLVRQSHIRATTGRLDRAQAIAAAAAEAEAAFAEGRIISAEETGISIPSAATWKPSDSTRSIVPPPSESLQEMTDLSVEPLEDMEHMQLTLAEAFFLTWALDCLTICHPKRYDRLSMSRVNALREIWVAFQTAYLSPCTRSTSRQSFLINYVFFHHYRSLGWVVKNGVKFSVDYLLYKRGPFAVVLIPVYEDPDDMKSSPFAISNVEPFTWQWLSTINRVNSQVQKTLVLSYVTIPAVSRLSAGELFSPACFKRYTVREIILRRFVPARMRD
ncbi:hypothetical protein BJV77DRAFT_1015309 [Russula vinacea]|nr:hypothetical protein BJV77DRAFT_1015309 [Russula vinacea]